MPIVPSVLSSSVLSRTDESSAGSGRGGLRSWLPHGRALSDKDWMWRHRVVSLVTALHLPVLVILGITTGNGVLHGFGEAVLAGAPLALAQWPRLPRRWRTIAASGALLTCSALLVHLFPAVPEVHFHYFVAVAAIALYQDWIVYALAIGFVALQHIVAGVFEGAAYGRTDGWKWSLIHAAFIGAESALLVIFWKASEQSLNREERLRAALVEGSSSVRARLEQADRMRSDLIGTVSHEFRTPLTGIRGAALTLLKRGERLDAKGRATLLHAILDQQERLSRLLENMLTAAEATSADLDAVAEVDAVAAEVVMIAAATRPDAREVSVVVEPGTVARIDRAALHQVIANLVDNAQQHGSTGAVPLVAGGTDENGVWLTVSNEGRTLDEREAGRLFEPFTQMDSGATRGREGMGMGLYVVRRLVEVYGGHVLVRSENDWVTVEVRLRPAPVTASTALAG